MLVFSHIFLSTTSLVNKDVYKARLPTLTPAVWNSPPKTVPNSDPVAVFKSRLKTFFFSQAFSFSFAY